MKGYSFQPRQIADGLRRRQYAVFRLNMRIAEFGLCSRAESDYWLIKAWRLTA